MTSYIYFIAGIYHSMDTSNGKHILVGPLTFIQNSGNSSSNIGKICMAHNLIIITAYDFKTSIYLKCVLSGKSWIQNMD